MINISEDEKEKSGLISKIIDIAQPWMQPEIYAKMKEEEEVRNKMGENMYSGYADELREQGVPEEDIKKFIKMEP